MFKFLTSLGKNKPWYRLPTPLALLKLVEFRKELRQNNLQDTSQLPDNGKLPKPVPSPDGRHLVARTIDGSFNDLDHPEMGMIGTRFGRNVPLKEVYPDEKNLLKLMVGMFAEDLPEGFGFSDTAFRVFILMASRRLKSDRFFTKDYRAEIYTQFGLDWIDNNLLTLLRRHHPELSPALVGVQNGFAPWRRVGVSGH